MMAVLDCDRVDVAAFATIEESYRVYTIRREVEVEAVIIGIVQDWYSKHVLGGVAPDIDESAACARALGLVFHKNAEKNYADCTDDEAMILRVICVAQNSAEFHENKAAHMKNELRQSMGERELYGLRIDGSTAAIYYNNKKGKTLRLFPEVITR